MWQFSCFLFHSQESWVEHQSDIHRLFGPVGLLALAVNPDHHQTSWTEKTQCALALAHLWHLESQMEALPQPGSVDQERFRCSLVRFIQIHTRDLNLITLQLRRLFFPSWLTAVTVCSWSNHPLGASSCWWLSTQSLLAEPLAKSSTPASAEICLFPASTHSLPYSTSIILLSSCVTESSDCWEGKHSSISSVGAGWSGAATTAFDSSTGSLVRCCTGRWHLGLTKQWLYFLARQCDKDILSLRNDMHGSQLNEWPANIAHACK